MCCKSLPHILLTGFEPFDHKTDNPSGDIAIQLNNTCTSNLCFDTLILPVTSVGASTVANLLKTSPNKYDAVLHLGEDIPAMFMKVKKAHIEIVASNIAVSKQGAIIKGAQQILPTTATISNSKFQQLLNANASIVKWSRDAGKYYCNEAYYQTLFTIRDTNISTSTSSITATSTTSLLPALFLHVPPIKVMSIQEGIQIATAVATAMLVVKQDQNEKLAILLAGFANRLGPDRGGAAVLLLNATCNKNICFDTIIIDFSNGGSDQDIASVLIEHVGKWKGLLIVAEQEDRMAQGLTLQAVGYKTDDVNNAVLPATINFNTFNPTVMPNYVRDTAAFTWVRDSGLGNAGKSFYNSLLAIHNISSRSSNSSSAALLATLPDNDNRSTSVDAKLVEKVAALMLIQFQ
jgi:pyrrolidone-carboxylate peptidase